MAFLLFFTSNGGELRFFYRDCDIVADTTDTFDPFLGPFTFIQRSVLKKSTDYCVNVTGREGVNTRGQYIYCVS